jgi:hypothetical protein
MLQQTRLQKGPDIIEIIDLLIADSRCWKCLLQVGHSHRGGLDDFKWAQRGYHTSRTKRTR